MRRGWSPKTLSVVGDRHGWSGFPHHGSAADQLVAAAEAWARSQHRMVVLAAEFADSSEWVIAGAPRLPPLMAGMLIAALTTRVITRRHLATAGRVDHASAVACPTAALTTC